MLFRSVETINRVSSSERRRSRVRVTVGTHAFDQAGTVSHAVSAYQAAHSDVGVVHQVHRNLKCRSLFKAGDLDLAVISSVPGIDEDLVPVRAWEDQLIWVGAATAIPTPDQPLPLIGDAGGSFYQFIAINACERAGRKIKFALFTDSFQAFYDALLQGEGIGLMARHSMMEKEFEEGKLLALDSQQYGLPDIADFRQQIGLCALPLEAGPAHQVQQALIEELSRVFDGFGLQRTI